MKESTLPGGLAKSGDVHGAMENRGTARFCSDGSCSGEKILSLVSSGVNSLDRNLHERRESRLIVI